MSSRKVVVQESLKTKKIREKIRKSWANFDQLVTPEALKVQVEEIHRWIARHAKSRIRLKNKKISLFDENQNTAKIGPRVRAIAQRLRDSQVAKNS